MKILETTDSISEYFKEYVDDYVIVDVENDPDTRHLLGVGLCGRTRPGAYVPLGHAWDNSPADDHVRTALVGALRGCLEGRLLVAHNAKHDLRILDENEIIESTNVEFACTLTMFHFVHEEHYSKDLTAVSSYYGGKPKERSAFLQSVIDRYGWINAPLAETAEYCINDAEITAEPTFRRVGAEFGAQFKDSLWDREQQWIRVVDRIERNRVRIDPELCRRESTKGRLIMEDLRHELGFNPNSSKDLNEVLINKLGLPVLKETPKGAPSFDKETMKQYEEEYIPNIEDKELGHKILRYRGWSKAVSTYYESWVEKADENWEIECNFKIHGTKTGRISCEKPNLQQIPKEGEDEWNKHTKRAFLARPGMVLKEFDFSQLEFRLAAAVARDTRLLDYFNDPDKDIFTEMAEELGWERADVKTLVYATLYGGGANRIKNAFGITIQEAIRRREEFFRRYPKLKIVSKRASDKASRDGFIEYWTGRRRHFTKGQSTHKAFNAWVQGGAFEVVKDSIIRLDSYCLLHPEIRIVLQVHDSVWCEYPTNYESWVDETIQRILEEVPQDFGVNFKIDVKELSRG